MENKDNSEKKPLNWAIDTIIIGSVLTLFFGTCFNNEGKLKGYFSKPNRQIESSLETESGDTKRIRVSKENYMNNMSLKEHYVIDYEDIKNKSKSNYKLDTQRDLPQKNLSNMEKIIIYGSNKDYQEKGSYTKVIPRVYLK
jgi:hypothetical protein